MDMFKRYTRQSTNEDIEIGSTSITGSTMTTGSSNSNSTTSGLGQRRRITTTTDTEPLLINSGTSNNPSLSTATLTNHIGTNITKDDSMNGTVVSNNSDTTGTSSTNSTNTTTGSSNSSSNGISNIGYAVLILLAVQNCSKNLLMRYVMQDQPKFLTSTAVLCCECTKLTLSVVYIVYMDHKSWTSIITYLQYDMKNTMLLAVPATAYNLQMKLEYVALANLNAAVFSVLVQTKLLFTAIMAATFLQKKLKYIQIISLVLLTVGVMLCNLSSSSTNNTTASQTLDSTAVTGILATLGIAISSGFASVYTEKVIKANRSVTMMSTTTTTTTTTMTTGAAEEKKVSTTPIFDKNEYGLAYTQVQLALMSICTIGAYALWQDMDKIMTNGLFYQFSYSAMFSVLNSAIGGLIVASVLKYADSVLKGYATAMSVILTGVLSMILFGTSLSIIYFLGIINVVTAVLLYNGKDLDQMMC